MNIIIAGDFCQNARLDGAIKQRKFGEIFDDVRGTIFSADYSIVNFEFPIVYNESDARPIKKHGPILKGSIESIDAIKYVGFSCCTLANNHIMDQGEKCCIETNTQLKAVGIDTVGVGKNDVEAEAVLYKHIGNEVVAIINCAEHEFATSTKNRAGANALDPLKQYYQIIEAKKKADLVLVIVHGGHELFQLPSLRMIDTYRFFIDAGADCVINGHQHCFSGYEEYKGKLIFYGLGNFCFDWNEPKNPSWYEGILLKLIYNEQVLSFEIIPFKQCLEGVSIKLLEEKEKQSVLRRIDDINMIINNRTVLESELDKYYSTCINWEIEKFEPYLNRLTRKLYRLGLLPHFVKNEKLLSILNSINCESHRDKVLFALKDKIG